MSVLLTSVPDLYVVQLEFRAESDEWLGYTHLQIHRSVLGRDGPYEELSESYWSSAVLPEDGGDPAAIAGNDYYIVGTELNVLIDQVHQATVTFTGVDPLTAAECVTQINSAISAFGSAWVDTAGLVVITSNRLGGHASLSVSGEGASILGLPIGVTVFGKDVRPVLSSSRTSYVFRDYFGSKDYFYKTRYFNSSSGAVSEFSSVVAAGSRGDIPTDELSVGYIRCVNSAGRAQQNVRVILYLDPQLASTQNHLITSAPQEKLTDENGYVDFRVIRGSKVTLAVPDNGMVRPIVVPDSDTFNFLDSAIGSDDVFDVRRITIAYGERRTI